MSKNFNFELGSRPLTADESRAVEIAKNIFRDSLERHQGRMVAGRAVFKAKSAMAATSSVSSTRVAEPAGDVPSKPRGTEVIRNWPTNKVAPANRKY